MMTKLLLIEDSLTIQHAVQTAFAPEEAEIITANDAAEALHILHSFVPDIVVADAFLPNIDGFHLCQIIRETLGLRHLPVILLTSNFAAYDQTRGERVGVTAHLVKPFEAHTLRQLIQQFAGPPSSNSAHAGQAESSSTAADSATWLQAKVTSGREENGAPDRMQPSSQPGQGKPPDELTAIISQWTPGVLSRATPSEEHFEHTLGQAVLAIVRDSLHIHLDKMVEQLTPQILAIVQEVVTTKTADLLEMLLQREIETLKRALADDTRGKEDQ
jgi:CheY-like chemotaxis protein